MSGGSVSGTMQIGRHRVRHGDVMDAGFANLMGGDRAYIMYCDPPWGNLKFWTGLNQKQTGETVEPAALPAFLDRMFEIAQTYVTGFLLVEYGRRWSAEIQKRGAALRGFRAAGVASPFYKSGGKLLPLDVHLYAADGHSFPSGYIERVSGTVGFETLRAAVPPLAKKGAIILDPCCGMGYTAQAAIDCGMDFRGNELNRVRLQKTIDRLKTTQL